jgi:hypothetical protein
MAIATTTAHLLETVAHLQECHIPEPGLIVECLFDRSVIDFLTQSILNKFAFQYQALTSEETVVLAAFKDRISFLALCHNPKVSQLACSQIFSRIWDLNIVDLELTNISMLPGDIFLFERFESLTTLTVNYFHGSHKQIFSNALEQLLNLKPTLTVYWQKETSDYYKYELNACASSSTSFPILSPIFANLSISSSP